VCEIQQILSVVFQPNTALKYYVISNSMLNPYREISPDQSMSVREIDDPNLIFIYFYPLVCTLQLHWLGSQFTSYHVVNTNQCLPWQSYEKQGHYVYKM